MSSISAGTTSGTALVSSGDTTGELQLRINGTTPSVTLAANGSVGVGSSPSYGTNGQVLTSAGTGSAPTWTTIASGLSAATQAEMEAATSNTVAATPSKTQYHPGVAKCWIKCDSAGGILGSYNISSITDNGTGNVTVTIGTDFSSANYSITTGVDGNGSFRGITIDVPGAGAFNGLSVNGAFNPADPLAWMFACFGDQA